MEPLTGLPDRAQIVDTLTRMVRTGQRPAVFAVAIHGYEELAASGTADAAAAMSEVVGRLGRLTRTSDVLGALAPGVFALVGPGVEKADTDTLLDRVQGVFALPVEVGEEAVSFPVTCGVAHAAPGVAGAALLESAEDDLRRRLAQR